MAFHGKVFEIADILALGQVSTLGARERDFSGVTTDSREVLSGGIFIARKGEQGDGHDYVEAALKKGASLCIVEESWLANHGQDWLQTLTREGVPGPVNLLGVKDPTLSLGKLASYWRAKLGLPTIAITGSNGKTSTRQMAQSVLTALIGEGTASEKSFNNHVGLPQTILNADARSKWLLLEAGMNHAGELSYLGEIARPDTAVVLNIGPAHIGYFGSLANIADAKCELLAKLNADGTAVSCQDDAELRAGIERLEKSLKKKLKQVTFGIETEADFVAHDIQIPKSGGSVFTVNFRKEVVKTEIPHLGRHNIYNALAATAIVKTQFPELSLRDICAALTSAPQPPMRMELLTIGPLKILNDCYNANPASVKSALLTASELAAGEGFGAILGDMLELGVQSSEFHREIGLAAARLGAKIIIAIGEYAPETIKGAYEGGLKNGIVAEDPERAVRAFNNCDKVPGLLLVKGSRGMKLERVTELLRKK